MPGRKKKPSHLKLIEGTDRKDRANPNEPKPARKIPPAPSWLDGVGKRAYQDLARTLDKIGVMTEADGFALAMVADAYSQYREAHDGIKTSGLTYTSLGKEGNEMKRQNPEVGIASDAWRRVMSGLAVFGLTPADRTKVTSALGNNEDPLEEFFRTGNVSG